MNVPKQSMPVSRILPSVSYSSKLGVNSSMKLVDRIKRLFNSPNPSPGTCTCKEISVDIKNGVTIAPNPNGNQCNRDRGFAPQCFPNGKCSCVKDKEVFNSGMAVQGFDTMMFRFR
jgi:hypothetical protein